MDRKRFIENLTSARKDRGLTQKQVAEALGVSDRTYSKWETGETEPGIDQFCRLAEFYGLSPADFFREETPRESVRKELETMKPAQAMLRIREVVDEAYDGLCDNGLYWIRRWSQGDKAAEQAWNEPLPTERAPEGTDAAFCDMGGGFFLRWWDREMNLRLLMLPAEAGDAFLSADGDELDEFFGLLKLSRRFLPLLERVPGREARYFTLGGLAKTAGMSPEETELTLKAMERYGFCWRERAETGAGDHWLYAPADTRTLRAILALAHLLHRDMLRRQEYLAKRGDTQ